MTYPQPCQLPIRLSVIVPVYDEIATIAEILGEVRTQKIEFLYSFVWVAESPLGILPLRDAPTSPRAADAGERGRDRGLDPPRPLLAGPPPLRGRGLAASL